MSDRKQVNRYSMANVLGFLMTMPPTKSYDYSSCESCACGRFLESIGEKTSGLKLCDVGLKHHDVGVSMAKETGYSKAYELVFHGGMLGNVVDPWTFGKAAERARALMRTAPSGNIFIQDRSPEARQLEVVR